MDPLLKDHLIMTLDEQRLGALQRALRATGAEKFDIDASSYADFLACILAEDASIDAVRPVLNLAVTNERASERIAAAVIQAWLDPSGFDAWVESQSNNHEDGAATNDGDAAEEPDQTLSKETNLSQLSVQPSDKGHVQPTNAKTSEHDGRANNHSSSAVARPFKQKLSQAERRKREPQASPNLSLLLPSAASSTGAAAMDGLSGGRRLYGADDDVEARVCRHFLAGGCFRSDCAFSHDVASIPCKFWLSSIGCATGDECPFLHEAPDCDGVDVRELSGDRTSADNAITGDAAKDTSGNDAAPESIVMNFGGASGAAASASAKPAANEAALKASDTAQAFLSKDKISDGSSDFDIAWMLQRLELIEAEEKNAATDDDEEVDGEDLQSNTNNMPSIDASDSAAFPFLPSGQSSAVVTPVATTSSGTSTSVAATIGARTLAAALPSFLLNDGTAAQGGSRLSSSAWTGAEPDSTLSSASGPRHERGDSAATRLAIAVLTRAFPSLPARDIRQTYVSDISGGRDIRRTAHILAAEHGVLPVPGVLSGAPASLGGGTAASASASAKGSSHSHHRAGSGRPADLAARRIAQSLERVSTGEAVSSLYRSLRAEAEALAKSRNLAFHRATRAYLAGEGAEAARFGRQGRELDERMRAAHARAAAEIFAARNAGGSFVGRQQPSYASGSDGRGSDLQLPPAAAVDVSGTGLPSPLSVHVFDLHGLHPSEAADVAEGLIRRVTSLGSGSGVSRSPDGSVWLAFLTGTRHHSQKLGKGGGSIQRALIEALEGCAAGSGAEFFDPPSGFISGHGGGGGGGGSRPGGGQALSGVIVVRCAAV